MNNIPDPAMQSQNSEGENRFYIRSNKSKSKPYQLTHKNEILCELAQEKIQSIIFTMVELLNLFMNNKTNSQAGLLSVSNIFQLSSYFALLFWNS